MLLFRNERSLYRRKCGLCSKDLLVIYAPEAPFPVYCKECWYSDNWSPFDYGKEYDFGRPFFEQLKELFMTVPRMGVFQVNSVNSPYANSLVDCKNIYLAYSVIKSENVMFSKSIDNSMQVLDSVESVGLEQCYENINCEKNYDSHFMTLSQNCIDSRFLYDCVNCKHCVMSSNLRNREYVIRNVQYSKEDYLKAVEAMDLGSSKALQGLKDEFAALQRSALHKYADVKKSAGSTGHHLMNVKNAKDCFEVYDSENIKYCYRMFQMKEMYDVCFGGWGELRYEHITGGNHSYNLRFSFFNPENIRNADYVAFSLGSSELFGCVGVKKAEYTILNKRYSPEEYKELRAKILEHMETMPYVDAHGRTWKYGEFFPLDLAYPLGYNESNAQELFPLTKEEALARGYPWKDLDAKEHVATKKPEDLPDSIRDVGDDILQEVVACAHGSACNHQCTAAFRIIPDELQFYKQKGLPLPRLCPNCRHYERLRQMEPLRLWKRPCQCAGSSSDNQAWKNSASHSHGSVHCPNDFQTPYSPERPETVYCEQCYQAEVV
jgi:hypothetical protein